MATALFRSGFRPFFLGAGLCGALLVPGLLGILAGKLNTPGPWDVFRWHSHEMVFGYGSALLAGFLLTAVPNWTGTPPRSGAPLASIFLLWLAARLAPLVTPEMLPLIVLLNAIFFPALIVAIVGPLASKRNPKTLIFVPLVGLLWLCQLATYATFLGFVTLPYRLPLTTAVTLFMLMVAIIGGRVIPFFSRCAIPGYRGRTRPIVEAGSVLTLAALLPLEAFGVTSVPVIGLWATVAVAFHLTRMAGWWDSRVLRNPLLWVLYSGYGWVVAGMALKLLEAIGAAPPSASLHAFTVGGMGIVGLGMMVRVSLGHSGRPLVATPITVLGFGLLNGAAALRVCGLLIPAGYLFAFAFALFVCAYLGIWFRPRPDGKAG